MSEKEQIVQGSYPLGAGSHQWKKWPQKWVLMEQNFCTASSVWTWSSWQKNLTYPKTIEHLYDHFMHYGVGSIMGGD